MEQEFTEFGESDKSLLVSNTIGGWVVGLSPFTVMTNIFC